MHELGEHLRTERQKQGLTVSFISEKTRISSSMIDALEAGAFDRIGIPLIIRGFIRSYCDALGVESVPLIEKYEKHIGSFDRQGSGFRKYAEWCRSIRRKGRSRVFLIVLIVILAIGTLVGGAWFSLWLKNQQSTEKTSEVNPSLELPSDLIRPQGGALASVEEPGGPGSSSNPSPDAGEGARESAAPGRSGLDKPGLLGIPCKPVSQTPSATEVLPMEAEEGSGKTARPHVLTLEAIRRTGVKLRIDDQGDLALKLGAGDRKELQVMRVVELELRDPQSLKIMWDGEIVRNGPARLRLPPASQEEGKKP
ncbi:MAG: helix-turn-helix domain-containing protein [Syntrophobacteraceae bacterium]|jgi:cytoskeletal protein RodZ|nr:helix-turn-helix domain-containing protein [Syntrophobacteraceae bacterium]